MTVVTVVTVAVMIVLILKYFNKKQLDTLITNDSFSGQLFAILTMYFFFISTGPT